MASAAPAMRARRRSTVVTVPTRWAAVAARAGTEVGPATGRTALRRAGVAERGVAVVVMPPAWRGGRAAVCPERP